MSGASSSAADINTGGVARAAPPGTTSCDGSTRSGSAIDSATGANGKRPRILYLSFYFPPSRASGVFRASATANHLAGAGWDVTVLTAPREFFTHYLSGASDETLEATVDPRVHIERPSMNMRHWETDLRKFGALRANFPLIADRLHAAVQNRIFPEPYLGWIPSVLRTALRLHREQRFDLVLATGNPFVSFAAARALGRLLRVPYVVDYRDAWTMNQFTEELSVPEGGTAMRWEGKVLRDAAEIVFVNDGMRRWHAERYPYAAERMQVVPNGWEPEIMGRPEFVVPDPDVPLRFAYLGTVTSYLPLDVLFDGWRRARQHPLLAGAELNIYGHLGFFPDNAPPLRQRIEQERDEGVHYRGAFGKATAASVYAQTDALVLCVPGARYVTSGKVFEYMASGKPVVSVHEPEIAAAEVLSGYPLWFAGARLDTESVAHSFVQAAKAARDLDRDTHEAALRHAQTYTRAATLGPWEARLRRLAEGAR
ncbi:glycosyltransferase [Micromonospora sp. NBC_00617]|uniref:glycosyltransferase n=1 Tax=Micromonospora sp. NBC_00617 TaxID=2903587 RepID=UPI0030E3CB93